MCQLLETIRVVNGNFENLTYHTTRCNAARKELFGLHDTLLLDDIILPEQYTTGIVKCRIVYSQSIDLIEFEQYIPKPISSLKIVYCNDIDYHLKYKNRTVISNLLTQKNKCDDILIVKQGMVTDMSYANLVFFDGCTWFTPSTPLLKGTMRQYLLDTKMISEAPIAPTDIVTFKYCKIINAMLPLESTNAIAINNIIC